MKVSFAQCSELVGADCNPLLNDQEIAIINKATGNTGYDLHGRKVAFIEDDGSAFFMRFPYPFNHCKRTFFRDLNEYSYRNINSKTAALFVLTPEQKKVEGGYDAVVLTIEPRRLKKVTPKILDKMTRDLWRNGLNFPSNFYEAGKDSNVVLSDANARFLTDFFQYSDSTYNFHGRKVGFLNGINGDVINPATYINGVKIRFVNDHYVAPWYVVKMTDEEKLRSGGYDAVVLTPCKMCISKEIIISNLAAQSK
jgi:hypothetical protein